MPEITTFNYLKIAHAFVSCSSTCSFTAYSLTKSLDISATVVFATLRTMEDKGLLSSILDNPVGRPRRLYSITENGRESALAQLSALQLSTAIPPHRSTQ